MLMLLCLLMLAPQAPRADEQAIRAADARYRDAWLPNDPDQVMTTLAGATILPNGVLRSRNSSISNPIANPQSAIQSSIGNRIANHQSTIADKIGNRHSPIGTGTVTQ